MRDYAEAVSKDQGSTKNVGSILVEEGTTSAIFHLLRTARADAEKSRAFTKRASA